jgi:hypothetical protein
MSAITPQHVGRLAVCALGLFAFVLVGCGDDGATGGSARADNVPPVAVLKMPVSAVVGVPVMLDATESDDPDGLIDRYLFEITAYDEPAEVVLEAASPQLTHTFDVTGRFEVVLTVVDNDGKKASDPNIIDVYEHP